MSMWELIERMEFVQAVKKYGSKLVIIEEDTDVGGVGIGIMETGTRSWQEGVTGELLGWFSEQRSEVCPCQSEGSLGD